MPTGTKNTKSAMTTIRIPHDQFERLKVAAAAENRSLANYLVHAGITRIDLIKLATEPLKLSPAAQALMDEIDAKRMQQQPE